MAHTQTVLQQLESDPPAAPDAGGGCGPVGVLPSVGQSLVHILQTHACLLLETEVKAPVTAAVAWRAQQCVTQWERMRYKHSISVTEEDEAQVGGPSTLGSQCNKLRGGFYVGARVRNIDV